MCDWFYQFDHGWSPFDRRANATLEEARFAGRSLVRLRVTDGDFEEESTVDLVNMQQRFRSQRVRKIQAVVWGETTEECSATTTAVSFQIRAETALGEQVFVVGDQPLLPEAWSRTQAIPLYTSKQQYPLWRTAQPVQLPQLLPIEYKYAVYRDGQLVRWEDFAENRRLIPEGTKYIVSDKYFGNLHDADRNTASEMALPHLDDYHWSRVVPALSGSLSTVADFERAVLSYNRVADCFPFLRWHFIEYPDEETSFFSRILPFIKQLVLDTPTLFPEPLPLLRRHADVTLTLTRMQCACLVANAFFCTYQGRNDYNSLRNYPPANFNGMFTGPEVPHQTAKLRMFLHYFDRIRDERPKGSVSLHRRLLLESPRWDRSRHIFRPISFVQNGSIDEADGHVQVDFASKFVGGFVVQAGAGQEETRFAACPELLPASILCESLQPLEVVVSTGIERFSQHSGYRGKLQFLGDYRDASERGDDGSLKTMVVSMDALDFGSQADVPSEFSEVAVRRELLKATCGFYSEHAAKRQQLERRPSFENLLPKTRSPPRFADALHAAHVPTDISNGFANGFAHLSLANGHNAAATNDAPAPAPVATGNWGGGVYRGDLHLKLFIQWMAASYCNRHMTYYAFGDSRIFNDEMQRLCTFVVEKHISIAEMWRALLLFCESPGEPCSLADFLSRHFGLAAEN